MRVAGIAWRRGSSRRRGHGHVGFREQGKRVIVLLTSAEDAVPVLGRFALFCCSESEGERDLLRLESASELPI